MRGRHIKKRRQKRSVGKREKVLKVAELLEGEYGKPVWAHEKHRPVDTLVGTILSQNTNDRNSVPAFNALRRAYPKWEQVLRADERRLAKVIRRGGLPQIKARRIKGVLAEVKRRNGGITLAPLARMKPQEAREWLMSLDGVGPKTAAVTLIFGFGMPVFPVDTHVFRVSKRLGLIGQKESYEKAHEILDEIVPDRKKARLHVNLLEHGRMVCTARKPKCGACVLNRICPSAFKFPNFRR